MRVGLKAIGLAIAVFASALPAVASAEWRRAESERFIVYSDGDERVLRDYVQKLENFDRVLRYETGLPIEEAPPRKLPIYLVARHAGLEVVRPGLSERIVGFYSASRDDIYAIGIRTRGEDFVLLHEYVHHFMMQNFRTGYPAWFVEGFAEYYMTAELTPNRVMLGKPTQGRTDWLYGPWIPLSDLLTKRSGQITQRQETYYPLSWLVTHWFLSDPARKARLNTYMRETGAGADPIAAMERAAGMPLPEFERTLRTYLMGPLRYSGFGFDFPRAEVTVTVLPASANDLLLISQRLKSWVDEDEKAAVLTQTRTAVGARTDTFARRTLARAEIDLGDAEAGKAILVGLVEADGEDVESLQLLAENALNQREKDDADPIALGREASGYLRRAYAANPDNYLTLYLLGRVRIGQPGYPTDNDMEIWGQAFHLAPQLDEIRINTAQALLIRDRKAEAIAVLTPLANSPHSGGAGVARSMLARARGEGKQAAEADETPDPVPPEG